MKCKVCGMRMADNIREVAALGIDMMGFICWPGSPRFVGHTPLPDTKGLLRVGVFVDQPAEEIYSYTRLHRLDAVQLHGNEAPPCWKHFGMTVPSYSSSRPSASGTRKAC